MSSEADEPRGRRSPTADELRAWRVFIETSEQLKGVVTAQLHTAAELSTGDYAVMLALFEHPQRCMRSSQLADHISWERSRLSHHIGRMERRGLVTRETAEGDSRGAVVTLTAEGARLFRRASPSHMHIIYSAFVAALSPGQLAAVEDAMLTLQAHLGHTDGDGADAC
ncbi:MarR family winged helix-turn-helix transcriptional regulator [Herbiconiux liangxiaofengii]|uniref:MarR family winged helix-turn-helix transcriptional regulator n=1 Tax=Herbiconiux liangxiaofengii TaxID=3342795 RepID=UPI0035BADE51